MIVRSNLLRNIILLVVAAIIISTLLIIGPYLYMSQSIYLESRTNEMMSRARAVASVYDEDDHSPNSSFARLLRLDSDIWDARLHIFDSGKRLLFGASTANAPPAVNNSGENITVSPHSDDSVMMMIMDKPLDDILSGEEIHNIYTYKDADITYLVVGVPIVREGVVTGAVTLSKPVLEVRNAMYGLNRALFLSLIISFLLMLVPTILAARRMVRPIRQMRDVSLAMAMGDFTLRTEESNIGEIGQLGQSLNYLASELSRTISALVIERNRLQQILDGLFEGIIAVDIDGVITHMNPAIERLFGPIGDLKVRLSVIYDEALWADMDDACKNGVAITRNLYIKNKIFNVQISPLEDDENRKVGAVALFRDITESERLEQTRRDYVANVSHELRTPVSSIRVMSESLMDNMVKDDSSVKRFYGNILHECLRLSRLIDDLLELSRLQSGNEAFDKRRFRLDELLQELAERYSILSEESGIRFEFSLQEEHYPIAYGNSDRIEQVLVILLDNAIKYTCEGGIIGLRTEWDEKRFYVHIYDTGCGISDDDLPNIFERFYKADKAHSTEGTGLGLSIAQQIMQLLGEEISAKSTENEGSVFTITVARSEG